jgi:hypothetical protein
MYAIFFMFLSFFLILNKLKIDNENFIIVPEEQSFKVQTEDWVSEQPYKKYFKINVTKVAKN